MPPVMQTVWQFACSMMISRCSKRPAGFSPPRVGRQNRLAIRSRFFVILQAYSPLFAVIDVSMPSMNGLEVQRRLCRLSPLTRVYFLTGKDDPAVRSQALAAGASALFRKDEPNKEFLAGIRAAILEN